MDNKFFIETKYSNAINKNENNLQNQIKVTDDKLVNNFINKNISLESIIENEILKNNIKI